jgi:pimeloyl-ACP methyl ester carboxylesterase
MVETRSGRGVMLLIHGLWLRPGVWDLWLEELDEAGYDVAVLSWSNGNGSGPPAIAASFGQLLRIAKERIGALEPRPIVIGHGVGGVVAERLLNDGDAAAAISLAPVPGGRAAIPTVARLLHGNSRLGLLSLRNSAVMPTFTQFRRTIATVGSNSDAQRFYEKYVAADKPRDVLLHASRRRATVRNGQPHRGPLLLATGGKDQLIAEASIALLHRKYRRHRPDAITDYEVFPELDHTLAMGTQARVVLFYCLDWLTAHNMLAISSGDCHAA